MRIIGMDAKEVICGEFDLMLAVCGYEKRATYIASKGIQADRKVCFVYKGRQVLNWKRNFEFFRNGKFEMHDIEDDSSAWLERILEHVIQEEVARCGTERVVRVLIDYSCCDRSWIGAMVKVCLAAGTAIQCDFVYAPAGYEDPGSIGGYNEKIEPVSGFWHLSESGIPVTLILGLGYERTRALGAREMLDPGKTVLFYTDPSVEKGYLEAVFEANTILLSQTDEADKFAYDLSDLGGLDMLLSDVCEGFSEESAVVIIPLGPKPFALVSFAVASRLAQVEVWRVTGGTLQAPIDRTASGLVIAGRLFAGDTV